MYLQYAEAEGLVPSQEVFTWWYNLLRRDFTGHSLLP